MLLLWGLTLHNAMITGTHAFGQWFIHCGCSH